MVADPIALAVAEHLPLTSEALNGLTDAEINDLKRKIGVLQRWYSEMPELVLRG